jgi:hypothetical protein
MAFAATTEVPVDKTRLEVEKLLIKRKAERFAYMYGADEAIVAFELSGRHYAFHLPLTNSSPIPLRPRGGRSATC